ncbi:MAG TPA: AbrB/MazE/SpoVT family DNA-binding domain-containing protein [Candidatus Limnocylindrales bacterium]
MRTTIAPDGSVRLPPRARARLGLDPGTPVRLEVQADRLVISRVIPRSETREVAQLPAERALLLRRDEAGEAYAALTFERRVHE